MLHPSIRQKGCKREENQTHRSSLPQIRLNLYQIHPALSLGFSLVAKILGLFVYIVPPNKWVLVPCSFVCPFETNKQENNLNLLHSFCKYMNETSAELPSHKPVASVFRIRELTDDGWRVRPKPDHSVMFSKMSYHQSFYCKSLIQSQKMMNCIYLEHFWNRQWCLSPALLSSLCLLKYVWIQINHLSETLFFRKTFLIL